VLLFSEAFIDAAATVRNAIGLQALMHLKGGAQDGTNEGLFVHRGHYFYNVYLYFYAVTGVTTSPLFVLVR